jgi:2-polyprenyl-6-methoxyphenol hydroxylase-like FAD-dependent oxidoreductase
MPGGGWRNRSKRHRFSPGEMTARPADPVDVLVVGAGPTGLALAAQLAAFGATVRVVDRRAVPGRASRALVIQPRTLEVLRPIGVTQALLDRGDQAPRVQLHLDGRDLAMPLPDIDADDTSYPFLLVLRQAEMEAALMAHLAAQGLSVEWGTQLLSYRSEEAGVVAALRHRSGQAALVRARYLVGCDGANSTVRRQAGVAFKGGDYRRSVLLADIDIDGDLGCQGAHVFVGPQGVLILIAIGEHARWRLLVVQANRAAGATAPAADDVRAIVESASRGRVRAHTVAWATQLPLQHRLAATFRSERAFLAGDAAHVHSPAGAQGMNSGIQDAINLGWKLALAAQGTASEALLDTYSQERRPVARAVLALTHVLFWIETADNPVVRRARVALAPLAVSMALRLAPLRRFGFRVIGQQWVRYPRGLAAVDGLPKLRRGPGAGHRLPDLPLLRDQAPCRLHEALATPGFHLLLCGPADRWDAQRLARFQQRHGRLVVVHRLGTAPLPGQLCDPSGAALARLGARNGAQYLVRPDGYVGYRCAGFDLVGLEEQMARLLPGQRTARPTGRERPGRSG